MKKEQLEDFPSRLAEASWLAACVLIPVSVDLQAGQIFTAPKAALIQILGICSALALGLEFIARPRVERSFLPIAAAALAFLAASLISQIYAIDSSRAGDNDGVVSLGPAHLACQIAIFLSMAYFLRTPQQLERLLYSALATGFTVAIFALFEAYGFKAPGYALVPGMQVVSFVGGPIFLAGYLLMLIPPAIWNVHRQLGKSGGCLDKPTATAAVVPLVLVAAFLACDKRGPTMGLLAAICSGLILLAAVRRRYRLILAALGMVALTALSLTGLAVLKKAESPLAKVPFVERLAAIVPVEGDRNHDYRTMLWALLPEMVVSPEPLILPSGAEDPHHQMRPLLGYGPDNLQAVLPSRYIFLQAWPSEVMEVSTHSHFWDLAINLGAAGLVAFFVFFFSVWYFGLREIGARPPPVAVSVAVAAGCAVAGGVIGEIFFRPGFAGVGAQAGFLAGLLCLGLLGRRHTESGVCDPSSRQLLVLALLASLAGHWTDLAFIFPTAENSVMFWIFAGAVCGQRNFSEARTEMRREDSKESGVWTFAIGSALVISVMHARVYLGPFLSGQTAVTDIFGHGAAPLLLIAITVAAIWSTCRLCLPDFGRGEANPGGDAACRRIVAAGLVYLAAVMWLAKWMQFTPTLNNPRLADVWALHYPVLAVAGVVAVSAYLTRFSVQMSIAAAALSFLFSVISVALIWTGPMRDWRSSISAGLARWMPSPEDWLESSVQLRPEHMRNYYTLANQLVWKAFMVEQDQQKRDHAVGRAENILKRGLEVSKFNLLSAKLGRLQLWRAAQGASYSRREALAESSQRYLREAVRFAPQNEPAWFDASLVERILFSNAEEADALLKQADGATFGAESWQNVVEEEWGAYYTGLAISAEPEKLRRAYAERALAYLQKHLAQSAESLQQSAGLRDTIRLELLRSRGKTLGHAIDCQRILGEHQKAAALKNEVDSLRRQLE